MKLLQYGKYGNSLNMENDYLEISAPEWYPSLFELSVIITVIVSN